MNAGPRHPSGGGGKNRRRRGRRPPHHGGHGGRDRQQHSGIYTAPMDHSYRAALAATTAAAAGCGQDLPPDYPHAIPILCRSETRMRSRIFAFVDDLFFQAKIQETARKMNVKVEFCKAEKDLLDRIKENGEEKPS